jgi:hypothetical protein
MWQVCVVCCERAYALHFLTCFVTGSFVENLISGTGHHVFNWQEVMKNQDSEKVLTKQGQICQAASDIIDALPACGSAFVPIFQYHERSQHVDPLGGVIEQAGNPTHGVGGMRKQVELAHPDKARRCFLSHCPFHSPFARGAHILASDEYAVPLASAFCRTVWCKCASFVVLMCTLLPVINFNESLALLSVCGM